MLSMLRSPVTIALVAITFVYWSAVLFVPTTRYLIEFTDGIVIATSAMVMAVYGNRLIDGLRKTPPDVIDLVIIGIAGAWFVTACDRMWRMVARVTASFYMLDHPIVGYMLSMLALFACFHLLVRSILDGEEKSRSPVTVEAWGVIVVSIVAGCAIGLTAIALDKAFQGGWS